jgi:hypothetical protein
MFGRGERSEDGGKDEWLTPRFIVEGLGPFDLDPCASIVRPWATARVHYTVEDDGLVKDWGSKNEVRTWMNPPYRIGLLTKWMKKKTEHLNGTALVYARTETENCAGAPSVLVAYDKNNKDGQNVEYLRMFAAKHDGHFLKR